MTDGFKFSLSIATEPLSPSAPVVYRGNVYRIIDKCKAIDLTALSFIERPREY